MSKALRGYAGRRVLVTGHTGFKGSWLCSLLCHLDSEVLGYALPPLREEDHFNVIGLEQKITHREADILNFEQLRKTAEDFQPEFVFHLAAQALVRPSYEEPKLTFDTNVAGSVNVLECIRTSESVKALVYITSDKCYRNREWIWGYRETDELGGTDPYGASKAAAEMVFRGYLESFFRKRSGVGAASVRAGNVIGGGDWAEDRILPDAIRALIANAPIPVRNPDAIRPWQHVLEPVTAYLYLGLKLRDHPEAFSGAWNFGPGEDCFVSVGSLVTEVIERWGSGVMEHAPESQAPPEASILSLNCDKASRCLGWRSRWDFHQAVARTVDWYKAVANGKAAADVTRGQLQEYLGDTP
ncbi:MAG: CDP-glucose 4,6-dehydratase [Candidatus Eisenbacteria sp.]|nr:CDP-glucose 4,6-dehydratase [Candidatus Eisenbacteria bacterium]